MFIPFKMSVMSEIFNFFNNAIKQIIPKKRSKRLKK